MKQNLAIGGLLTLATVACVFWLTACSRLPRSHTSATSSVNTSMVGKLASVNLNTASAAELGELPGVGPVLAERIITFRNENGRFRRVEHLMMVRGVSDRKFRELRSMIRVE